MYRNLFFPPILLNLYNEDIIKEALEGFAYFKIVGQVIRKYFAL